MSATITLFDPRTGQSHQVVDRYTATNPDDDNIWNWTEGNWGCDCNRELELWRAGIPGYSGDVDKVQCGDNLVLKKIVADDGRVLYEE